MGEREGVEGKREEQKEKDIERKRRKDVISKKTGERERMGERGRAPEVEKKGGGMAREREKENMEQGRKKERGREWEYLRPCPMSLFEACVDL